MNRAAIGIRGITLKETIREGREGDEVGNRAAEVSGIALEGTVGKGRMAPICAINPSASVGRGGAAICIPSDNGKAVEDG